MFRLIAVCAAVVSLAGCITQGSQAKLNTVNVGMSKSEVIEVLGAPVSTAAKGGTEYMDYRLTDGTDTGTAAICAGAGLLTYGVAYAVPSCRGGSKDDYFVRLVDGKVDAYGKRGDFDSTKIPESAINATPKSPGISVAQGSCFFASRDGAVITNHHVVEGKSEFQVIDNAGVQFGAVLEKTDPSNDLAVLKVRVQNHKHLSVAPFGSLKTGQEIFAVGYPVSAVLGTEVKFTDGAVSSTTGMNNMANMFQMTVPIQPGSSGGPVLNEEGQVVGVATSSAAAGVFLGATGSLPQNVNWAIKSEYVSLLTGIDGSAASWESRQGAIEAAIGASCMVKAL